MGPKTEQLIQILVELEKMLSEHDRSHWAKWMAKSIKRLRNSDFSGITHLLGAYGGMGSFNDVVFHPLNNDDLDDSEIIALNEQFSHLRSQAWTLADEIKRAVVRAQKVLSIILA